MPPKGQQHSSQSWKWGVLLWGWRHKKSKCPKTLSRKHNARGIKASSEVTHHRVTATKAEWLCKGPDVETKGTQQRTHKQTHTTEVTKFSKVSKHSWNKSPATNLGEETRYFYVRE